MEEKIEIDIELTEDMYHDINALAADRSVELENLYCMQIVKSNDSQYGIFWLKNLFQHDNRYYVTAKLMCPLLETHSEAVEIMKGLAEHLRANGIPVVHESNKT